MNVNFIITAFNKEEFLPLCLKTIRSYKTIRPRIVVCYNGSDPEFPADIRRDNLGHQRGDKDLTLAGYNHHWMTNSDHRFIKIGIDTFLLNEQPIIEIFDRMEKAEACYAGNRWGNESEPSLATDIIFLDTRFGNPLCPPDGMEEDGPQYEFWMWNSVHKNKLKIISIDERIPVHPNHRLEFLQFSWTMHHQLENNIDNMRRWGYGHLL